MAETSFPKDRIRILLLENIHDSAVETFASQGYTSVERVSGALSGSALIDKLDGVHMLGIRSGTHLTSQVLASAQKLMAVGCFCIGTNQVDLDAAAECGIPVFNAPHSNTRSVAELVLAEAVMLQRRLIDKIIGTHAGKWDKSASGSHELRGKTLGIVGYGHIGSQVSVLAEAFGMRVVYVDVEPKLPLGNAMQLESLDALLERSDVVTLHVPETPQTHLLIDAQRLSQMRKGAMLINASRGTVVDIDALAAHLRSGHIAGAAVDVFPKEPKSANEPFVSPLQGVPNVILTPHIGGSTLEAQRNIGVEVATKLIRYSDLGATVGAVGFPNIALPPTAAAHRVLHVHRNRPGVLGAINRVLADRKANILGQHLQTQAAIGYVVTDIDTAYEADLLTALREVDGTIRCRVVY